MLNRISVKNVDVCDLVTDRIVVLLDQWSFVINKNSYLNRRNNCSGSSKRRRRRRRSNTITTKKFKQCKRNCDGRTEIYSGLRKKKRRVDFQLATAAINRINSDDGIHHGLCLFQR